MLTGRFAVEPKHTTGVLTLFRFRVITVQPDIFSSLRCDQSSVHRALLLTPSLLNLSMSPLLRDRRNSKLPELNVNSFIKSPSLSFRNSVYL